ncbi:DnaJ family domain-containing protein [Bacillus marinisedimentorum]|uniref:DnaJ family domain-containing protein n=1 Tax=Bacillus marinisedimentorum TaxID=1821260 RepID=UPI000872FC00|nr:DnaJ family domain-containing protein [Bacillus marinisedimentorum]
MDYAAIFAEERIKNAIKDGEFDDLPGKGKPLQLEDMSQVPAELRTGYKILKNAGLLPEEVQLKKDMVTIQDLIDACDDEKEKQQLEKRLNEKMLRFTSIMEKRSFSRSRAFSAYKDKIYNRLT